MCLNLDPGLGETVFVDVHREPPEGVVLHQDGDLLRTLAAKHFNHVGAEALRGSVENDRAQQKAVTGLAQFGVRGGGRREHQQFAVVAAGVLTHPIEDVRERRPENVLSVVLLEHLFELNQALLGTALGVWRVEVNRVLLAADFHAAGLVDLMNCKLCTLCGHEA